MSKYYKNLIAIGFWVVIWQFLSMKLDLEMLLPPFTLVLEEVFALLCSIIFWKSLLFSFSRVVSGFFIALLTGTLFAVLAYCFEFVKILVKPLVSLIKATPVVSYVILCLFFLKSSNLSIIISFLMVFPIIYINILEGLLQTDKKLLEMAKVFKINKFRKIVFIYFYQLLPFLISACNASIGMSWKSGIAAEVIGLPVGSVGERLYQSKIYFDTKLLFAWTIIIVLVSFIFEKIFIYIINLIANRVERI